MFAVTKKQCCHYIQSFSIRQHWQSSISCLRGIIKPVKQNECCTMKHLVRNEWLFSSPLFGGTFCLHLLWCYHCMCTCGNWAWHWSKSMTHQSEDQKKNEEMSDFWYELYNRTNGHNTNIKCSTVTVNLTLLRSDFSSLVTSSWCSLVSLIGFK